MKNCNDLYTSEMQKKDKERKQLAPYFSFAGLILAILCVCIVSKCYKNEENKRIFLSQYYSITFAGYNNQGTASCSCRKDLLVKDILEKNGIRVDSIDNLCELNENQRYRAIQIEEKVSGINAQLNEQKGLSNGDVVTGTIKYDKSLEKTLKVRFVSTNLSAKVTGLE